MAAVIAGGMGAGVPVPSTGPFVPVKSWPRDTTEIK
jgi:hypothetical protein